MSVIFYTRTSWISQQ